MNLPLSSRGLSIGWEGARLFRDLDLHLPAGELVALLGPNGAGKSTLLRTLAGLQTPLSGEIRLGGDDLLSMPLHERSKRLSFVPASRPSVEGMTGRELVRLGRTPHLGWSLRDSADDSDSVDRALESVKATELADRPLDSMSDGEFQRITIARALAQGTSVILLDEPTAHLDLGWKVEILKILRQAANSRGMGVIVSTHDLEMALRLADRLWLAGRDGAFCEGIPEQLALAGDLDSLIEGSETRFDPESGHWVLDLPTCGTLAVTGSGPRHLWALRLASRLGWAVDDGASWRLEAHDTHWVLKKPGLDDAVLKDLSEVAHALILDP